MRRLIAVLAALGLVLALGASQALAADKPNDNGKGPKDNDTKVQLLAINDFHGHLEPTTPGTIQVGCCNPVQRPACRRAGRGRFRRAASSTSPRTSRRCATQNSNTITVGAGDLIGASPLISGALPRRARDRGAQRDRPRRDRRRQPRVRRGHRRAPPHAERRLPPRRRLPDGDAVPRRDLPATSRPTCSARATDETSCPPYEIRKFDNAKIAFIGLTLEGTPTIVTPTGVAGLDFRDEVETINALVQKLRNENGVARSSSCSTRAASRTRRRSRSIRPGEPRRLHGRQQLRQLRRGRDHRRSRPASTRRSTSSSAPTRTRRTSARSAASSSRAPSSFGRAGHRHRPRDRPPDEGRQVGDGATT